MKKDWDVSVWILVKKKKDSGVRVTTLFFFGGGDKGVANKKVLLFCYTTGFFACLTLHVSPGVFAHYHKESHSLELE